MSGSWFVRNNVSLFSFAAKYFGLSYAITSCIDAANEPGANLMLKDGQYIAWFKTERGQGTGRVTLRNGKISGGDTVISYGGSYQVDGSHFTAILTTRRHTAGQPSVFGIDEVEIKLSGTAIGNFASCSGEVEQVPGMLSRTTLIPVKEEAGKRTEEKFNPVDFHPERLPKGRVR
jgi:hypothetical protein